MAQVSLDILIKAIDHASGPLNGIGGHIEQNAARYRKSGAIMTGVGAAITGTLLAMTTRAAAAGDEIAKAADKTGASTEALSKLRWAGEQSGVSFGQLEMAVGRMQREVAQSPEKFERLGIAVRDANGQTKDADVLMGEVADRLQGIADPAQRAQVAYELFGRAGMDLLPMLKNGSAGLAAMGEEAERLGLVFSEDAARASEAFNDSLNKLKQSGLGLAQTVMVSLAPIITDLADRVAEAVGRFNQFAEEHPTLARAAVLGAGALGALLAVLGPIVYILPTMAAGIKTIVAWKTAWAAATTGTLVPSLTTLKGSLKGVLGVAAPLKGSLKGALQGGGGLGPALGWLGGAVKTAGQGVAGYLAAGEAVETGTAGGFRGRMGSEFGLSALIGGVPGLAASSVGALLGVLGARRRLGEDQAAPWGMSGTAGAAWSHLKERVGLTQITVQGNIYGDEHLRRTAQEEISGAVRQARAGAW